MKEKKEKGIDSFRDFRKLIAILFCILTVTFLLFVPKVSSTLFSPMRQLIWTDFVKKSEQNGTINPQEFWKFREFYSPGYFEFSRSGLQSSTVKKTLKELNVQLNPSTIDLAFLKFNSPKTISLDILTSQSDLQSIINSEAIQKDAIIFETNNTLITTNDEKTATLIFLKNTQDMKKANGYFDYGEKDRDLVQDKYWLNISKITLD